MTPYIEGELPPETVEAWRRASRIVAAIPDDFADIALRCHELARAVARIIGGTVVDGHFGAVEHSWITVPEAILDPYQPGTIPPCVLVSSWPLLPYARLYEPGEPRTDVDDDLVESLVTFLADAAG